MVGAVTGRAVAVAVQPILARQQPIEGRHEVVVRPGPDLDDHEPGRRMGHEDRQQPVAVIGGLVDTLLNPGYSTAVGLLQWGAGSLGAGDPRYASAPAGGGIGRLRDAIRNIFP